MSVKARLPRADYAAAPPTSERVRQALAGTPIAIHATSNWEFLAVHVGMRSAVYPRVVGVSLGVLPLCPYWIFGNFKDFRGGFDSDLGQTRSPGAAALAPAFDGSCASRTLPRCPSLHPHGAASAEEMQ